MIHFNLLQKLPFFVNILNFKKFKRPLNTFLQTLFSKAFHELPTAKRLLKRADNVCNSLNNQRYIIKRIVTKQKSMSSIQNTSTGKQLLIQLGINLVASAIVSYVMYRILQNAEQNKLKTTGAKTTPTPPLAVTQTPVTEEV